MDSGTFGDFLSQIPPQIIALFGVMLIMLIATVILIALVRSRQAGRPAANRQPTASGGRFNLGSSVANMLDRSASSARTAGTSTPPVSPGASAADDDLPDLDMLLQMTAPKPDPAPAHDAAPIPDEVPRQPGIANVRLTNGTVVEAVEMLIISRERQSDRLIVQIGEYAYTGTESDIHPDFRKQFVRTMKDLSPLAPRFSKGAKSSASKPSQAPAARPAAPQVPAAPPKANTPVEDLDLAGQIDAYVQKQLRLVPEFAGRDIQIHSAPEGGVQIQVDDQFFPGIGDVTDPDVRAFLAAAVQSWQSEQDD